MMTRNSRAPRRRSLRIVQVLPSLKRGGTEGQVAQLSHRLQGRGHEVSVVAVHRSGGWEPYLRRRGVHTHVLGCPRPIAGAGQAVRTVRMVCRILRRCKAQVVNGYLYPWSIWTSLAAAVARRPVALAHRRDCGFMRANAPLPRWLEVASYAATSRFAANSRAVARSLERTEGIPPERVAVIYNAVHVPEPNPEPPRLREALDIPARAPLVGMLANFNAYKNHLMLVRAASTVVERVEDARFVLAGYHRPYKERVVEEIDRLGLSRWFHVMDALAEPEELLRAMDVGVLCSTTEGFSNAILEYMAHGKPVVATRVGGNPEAVCDGETGYLVGLDDDAAMAEALVRLLRDPTLCARMGERGRERAREQFGWQRAVTKWEELFFSLLDAA